MQLPIVLVGPMGAGKTTLGKKLAKLLSIEFADTDKIIAKQHGPIPVIFEKFGESHFRDLETAALKGVLHKQAVVATGGGIILQQENRDLLSQANVIFLDSASKHVLPKLNTDKRPLLRENPAIWDEIYSARLPLYKEVAKSTLFTGGKPVSVALQELEKLVKKDSHD
ncbi:MAG: hypothetical protein RIS51_305 [Actinomycetota bacterium]